MRTPSPLVVSSMSGAETTAEIWKAPSRLSVDSAAA